MASLIQLHQLCSTHLEDLDTDDDFVRSPVTGGAELYQRLLQVTQSESRKCKGTWLVRVIFGTSISNRLHNINQWVHRRYLHLYKGETALSNTKNNSHTHLADTNVLISTNYNL
ncbi:hypothetical protein DSL72_003980 [Monilinia vaccinii-corymbosi]|uniref:Uncharacterized protein n=1 Tax=Monilinia vaccinii-corymbosi TaxID=61207 RepID=A0A8A3P2R8_9HELO|nr:hypothetical protein DSL72_003980 [Monilinia vaccinii-corymbosi]